MAETPFMGEIKWVSFNFAPKGWALCNGQLLPINQNQALFSLLGVTYGGDGRTNFALPDLRGRVPLHFLGSFILGTRGGQEAHTVTTSELPAHNHFYVGDSVAANTGTPLPTARLANSSPQNLFGAFGALTTMNAGSIQNVGGSQAHQNMQPYLVLTAVIALQGIFPSPN